MNNSLDFRIKKNNCFSWRTRYNTCLTSFSSVKARWTFLIHRQLIWGSKWSHLIVEYTVVYRCNYFIFLSKSVKYSSRRLQGVIMWVYVFFTIEKWQMRSRKRIRRRRTLSTLSWKEFESHEFYENYGKLLLGQMRIEIRRRTTL